MNSIRTNYRTVILALVVLLLAASFYFGTNMSYRVDQAEGAVVIHWITDIRIPIRDIRGVTVFEKAPGMHRLFGASLLNIRQGTFTVSGVGKVKMYAVDIRRKLVIIKTNKAIYGITPEDPAGFVAQLPAGLMQ